MGRTEARTESRGPKRWSRRSANMSSKAAAPERDWRKVYATRLVVTDFVVLVWVVFGVQIAWFGFAVSDVAFRDRLSEVAVSYTTISILVIIAWMTVLGIYGTRAYRVVGNGTQEYKLLADSTARLFGLIAILAFLFKIDLARGYILIAFPLGLLVLMFSRWLWRQWLGVQRLDGKFAARVLLVGSASSAAHIAKELARSPSAGYLVVGACIPAGKPGDTLMGGLSVPVFGAFDQILDSIDASHADTVVITSSNELTPDEVRELSWSLEPGRRHLVVAPGLTGISGPRIHTRPVAGLPLIHVETPRYEGGKLFAKRSLDLLLTGALTIVLSPLLLLIALIVRFTSDGPVLFRQERIGHNGKQFDMLKFRSMVANAEQLLVSVKNDEDVDRGNAVLFKMQNDPRVTPVGRFLRRFSLDELPQLFNVLGGSMSLVGPRPPLRREVELYETHVHRRFLVRPGVTGLWQVSGRSNLSWEDSVRLDLYYVENWSMTGDLVILWRTARAVLASEGAY
jgi:exopolysaccharide biosynthesis polyprenyl glycosylphosphotransferase